MSYSRRLSFNVGVKVKPTTPTNHVDFEILRAAKNVLNIVLLSLQKLPNMCYHREFTGKDGLAMRVKALTSDWLKIVW